MSRAVLVVDVLMAVLMAPLAANADETAKEHYERGTTAYALGKFAEAAEEYEKAFTLKRDPALLYNAAQSHRLAGNKQRALTLYSSYLGVFGDQVSNRDEIRRRIAELKQAIDAEKAAQTSPPNEPVPIGSQPPKPTPTPVSPSVVMAPVPAAPPPPVPKRRAWVWGVVAGTVAVVGIGLGVGLGVGLSSTRNPTPTYGVATLQ
jgi:tetratricopeptide (TPR) repeat protein